MLSVATIVGGGAGAAEMMVAAEAAVGSCGGGEGIECSLAVFSHPHGQLVIKEAAGLLYCGVAAAGFT